jgi:hypothetical protein
MMPPAGFRGSTHPRNDLEKWRGTLLLGRQPPNWALLHSDVVARLKFLERAIVEVTGVEVDFAP